MIGTNALAGKLIEKSAQNPADIILKNQFALIHAFQQLAAQPVDSLALLVHHVIVFEQVFARFEVLPFNRLLCALDALGNHLRLDRHAFFHAQPLQQRAHPLLGKDAHQVVFKREIESRLAGIALAARASPKLVVDAPRLVPLSAEDEEPTSLNHLLVIFECGVRMALVALGPVGVADLELLPLVIETQETSRRHGIDSSLGHADGACLVLLHQFLASHEIGIAAQQNIGSAACHVGGNRHHPQPARLSHNLRLAFVELGIQHYVPHTLALQNSR